MSNAKRSYTGTGLLALMLTTASAFATDDMMGADDLNGKGLLNRDYRLMTTQTCVRTPFQRPPAAGFDPVTRQLLVPGEAYTAVGTALVRFANDGTVAILDGIQTEISVAQLSPGQVPVTPPAEFACSGTYDVQQNTISISVSCDVKSPQPGVSVELGPLQFVGSIGKARQTIALTNISGSLQTVTVSAGGNAVQQRHRMCSEHALLIKQ